MWRNLAPVLIFASLPLAAVGSTRPAWWESIERLEGMVCASDRARVNRVAPDESMPLPDCAMRLPGAVIHIGDDDGVIRSKTSDEQGRFAIDLPDASRSERLARARITVTRPVASEDGRSYSGFSVPLAMLFDEATVDDATQRLYLAIPACVVPGQTESGRERSARFHLDAQALSKSDRHAELARLGWIARNTSVTDTDGTACRLAAPGRITLLSFWAPWCGPCVDSLPDFSEVRSAWPEDELRMIGISLACTNAAELRDFAASHAEIGWPLVCDELGDESLATAFGVRSIPAAMLIGKRGDVLATVNAHEGDLSSQIAEHLE